MFTGLRSELLKLFVRNSSLFFPKFLFQYIYILEFAIFFPKRISKLQKVIAKKKKKKKHWLMGRGEGG
jgi:hypothetical protein